GGRLGAVLCRLGFFIFCGLGRVRGISFGSSLGFSVGGSAGFLLGRDRRDFFVARQGRDFVDRRIIDQARCRQLGLVNLRHGVDQARRVRRAFVARQLDGVADG